MSSRTFAADGLPASIVLGDQASTQRAFAYDQQRRMRSVQTFRAMPGLWSSPSYTPATDATQQLLLEDCDLSYDAVGNVIEIKDWRTPSDWPAGAKPVSRAFEYDDLYRLTRTKYDYAGGSDTWTSPFAAENSDPSRKPQPSPHVAFAQRVKEQRYSYDHLGNTTRTTDDSSGFFDRSLGDVENGTTSAGPHQLRSSSNRTLASGSARKGDLAGDYDAAGNLKSLINRRDGPCEPTGASCWQRFAYLWDELGRLVEARRWDLAAGTERNNHGSLTSLPPARAPDALLRHLYDGVGQRVIKTAEDPSGAQSHTVYLLSTLELRRTWWTAAAPGTVEDYALNPATESVILPAGDARVRIVYSQEDLPTQSSGHQHAFIELSDYLGTTAFVIDRATGELVEHSTYMAYGGAESDYRPGRWGQFREPYKFSGKEEDIEVGLQYFGARYLVVGLGRWASTDAATIHYVRSDPNPYAYVAGRPTVSVDPNGNEPITVGVIVTAIVIGAAVGATAATTAYIANNGVRTNSRRWWRGLGNSAAIGAAAGGVAGGLTMGTGAILGVEVGAGAAMPSFLGQALPMGVVGGASGSATSTALAGGSAADVANSAAMGGALGAGTASLGALAGIGASASSGSGAGGSVVEAAATGIGQGAAAYGYQKLTGGSDDAATYAAASAGLNGTFAGARGIYDWENASGWAAAALDASLGLTGTTIGNAANLVNATGAWGAEYNAQRSQRQNRTVYTGGIKVPGADMTTFGGVVSGDSGRASRAAYGHENVHIWQSRLLGDAYWTSYMNWWIGGSIAGAVYAPFAGENVIRTMDVFGYWNNPYEVQARRSEPGRGPLSAERGAW